MARKFQSTPPRRGDRSGRRQGMSESWFQSTPPRRGDPFAPEACRGPSTGFNPRPREGATARQRRPIYQLAVSIHAPAKGRRQYLRHGSRAQQFQSTPPRRGDLTASLIIALIALSFNPRPREGATTEGSESGYEDRQFQSTPPRRGDNLSLSNNLLVAGFNPRPREGATMRTRPTIAGSRFQSTPPRRGDQRRRCHLHRPSGFQSTPPRRGDHQMALGLRSDTP